MRSTSRVTDSNKLIWTITTCKGLWFLTWWVNFGMETMKNVCTKICARFFVSNHILANNLSVVHKINPTTSILRSITRLYKDKTIGWAETLKLILNSIIVFDVMWFNIICHDIDILDDHLKMYHILLSIYSAYTTKPPVQTLSLKMVFELL